MPAPTGNQYALGNKGGRPTMYKDEYADQAYKLCLLGHTDAELATFFGVAESTINEWKLAHEEFSESVTRGKILADADVAVSFFKRATGYTYPAEKVFQYEGGVVRASVEAVVLPDPGAALNWLKNRQPDKWRDKKEHDINHSGSTRVSRNQAGDIVVEDDE